MNFKLFDFNTHAWFSFSWSYFTVCLFCMGPICKCASFTKSERPFQFPVFCRCFDRRFYWTHRRWELCCCFFIFTLKRLMGKPKNIKIENIDTEKDHKSLQSLQRIYSLYMTDTIFPRFIKHIQCSLQNCISSFISRSIFKTRKLFNG